MNCCSLRTYCKTGLPQSDLAYLAYALFPLTSRSPRLGSPLFSTYWQKAPGNSLALFSPVTAFRKIPLTPRITPARPWLFTMRNIFTADHVTCKKRRGAL